MVRDAAANFLSLACRDNLASDYYAFRDQDDIWEPDYLGRAIGFLERTGAAAPASTARRRA